uniref:Uncharacterized protein n=1 Tax=Sphaeramia orbicularis TaxID=375764 RepID=A0A673AFK2_9TELE
MTKTRIVKTFSWMKPEPPSYNTWIQKVWNIYQITYLLRLQKTIFTKRREPMLPLLLQ